METKIEETAPPSLVSDICFCGRFRIQHLHGSGDSQRTGGACADFGFMRRCDEADLQRWVDLTVFRKGIQARRYRNNAD